MGLFKKQMLKVIEWQDDSLNEIVHKLVFSDRYAIMKGSELIVRPSQAAVLVYRGQIADVFGEGHYTIDDGATPVLTKLANWKYAFENPKETDVYFVSLRRFLQLKWGTPNPIMMRDKEFGMIRVLGHGEYTFHVSDAKLFMRQCFGTIRSYRTEDIEGHLKSILLSNLADLLGECKIPALDLAANYLDLGAMLATHMRASFNELGVDVDEVIIRNLTLPPEVERAMDKRTMLGVFDGKMGEYAQFESVGAMRDAAKNPGAGGAFAGAGIGMGVGARIGAGFVDNMNAASSVKCPSCGHTVKADAKFCPDCGKPIAASVCAYCGSAIPSGAKFCPNCGKPTEEICPSCGKPVKGGVKFCPECGAKLK